MARSVPFSTARLLSRLELLSWPFYLLWVAIFSTSLVMLGLSEYTVRLIGEGDAQITHILNRQEAAYRFSRLFVELENAERGYLLLGDSRFLESYQETSHSLMPAAQTLRQFVPENSNLNTRLDRVDTLTVERLGIAAAIIGLVDAQNRNAALAKARESESPRLMNLIKAEMRSFRAENALELKKIQSRYDAAARISRLALGISVLITVILLVIMARLAIGRVVSEEKMQRRSTEDTGKLRALIDSRTEDLAALSTHLQNVVEKEKAELARNLHDELGGLLTAARMDLAWLQGATAGKEPTWDERLEQLSDELIQAMDIKRRVVESLHPALLDHFGLTMALSCHFEETCTKAGLNSTTAIDKEFPGLPEEIAIGVFRVGQEALTNIVRHAAATNVHLGVTEEAGNLVLEIRDDGVGMETSQVFGDHSYGIIGMQHRVKALGGRFDLSSRPGRGTRIRVRVPVPATLNRPRESVMAPGPRSVA